MSKKKDRMENEKKNLQQKGEKIKKMKRRKKMKKTLQENKGQIQK